MQERVEESDLLVKNIQISTQLQYVGLSARQYFCGERIILEDLQIANTHLHFA
jgi:hypothetical protein